MASQSKGKGKGKVLYRRHTTMAEWEAMRLQLRIAWTVLGCRCAYYANHEVLVEDAHCPVHGWYGSVLDGVSEQLAEQQRELRRLSAAWGT